MQTLRVVAAIFIRDGRALACRRAAHKAAAGMWEFPGGKIEPGESATSALEREIFEELGLACSAQLPFDVSKTWVGELDIMLETIFCSANFDQPLRSSDHDQFSWVTAEDALSLKWAEPDLPAVSRLISEGII